jgi:hypothetical protein
VHPYFTDDAAVCAASGEPNVAHGCFLLTQQAPQQHAVYNTLTQLLTFTASRALDYDSLGEDLLVTLSFRNGPNPCSGVRSTTALLGAGAAWLALVDAFYATANAAETGVQWILDGDALPLRCLSNRWQHWSAVFTTGVGPREALDSNSRSLGRYRLLSEPAELGLWETLAVLDYGKFSHGALPYQLWSPHDQASIRQFLDVYESGRPHEGGLQFQIDSDYAMLEVFSGAGREAQLQTASDAASSATENTCRSGLSTALQLNTSSSAQWPRIVALTGSTAKGTAVLALLTSNGTALQLTAVTAAIGVDGAAPAATAAADEPLLLLNSSHLNASAAAAGPAHLSAVRAALAPDTATSTKRSCSSSSSRDAAAWCSDTVLISTASGAFQLYNVTVSQHHENSALPGLEPCFGGALPRPGGGSPPSLSTALFLHRQRTVSSSSADNSTSNRSSSRDGGGSWTERLVIAELLGGSSADDALCHPRIQLAAVVYNSSSSSSSGKRSSSSSSSSSSNSTAHSLEPFGFICVLLPEKVGSKSTAVITSGTVTVAHSSHKQQQYLVVAVSDGTTLYGGAVSTAQAVPVANDDSNDHGDADTVHGVPLKYLGAGSDPHLSAAEVLQADSAKQHSSHHSSSTTAAAVSDVVLLVSGNGYSYDRSTSSSTSGCHALPSATPATLDYTVGQLDDWLQWLAQPLSPVTPCDLLLYHGTYDRGSRPAAVLYPTQHGKLVLATVHQAEQHSAYTASLDKGASVHQEGIVMSSFSLPRALLEGGGGSGRSGNKWQYREHFWDRHRDGIVVSIVLSAAAVVVIAVVLLWQWRYRGLHACAHQGLLYYCCCCYCCCSKQRRGARPLRRRRRRRQQQQQQQHMRTRLDTEDSATVMFDGASVGGFVPLSPLQTDEDGLSDDNSNSYNSGSADGATIDDDDAVDDSSTAFGVEMITLSSSAGRTVTLNGVHSETGVNASFDSSDSAVNDRPLHSNSNRHSDGNTSSSISSQQQAAADMLSINGNGAALV